MSWCIYGAWEMGYATRARGSGRLGCDRPASGRHSGAFFHARCYAPVGSRIPLYSGIAGVFVTCTGS